jgi:hypothetical protein
MHSRPICSVPCERCACTTKHACRVGEIFSGATTPLPGDETDLRMPQRELRVLQEEAHIHASHKELCLLALKLQAEALRQRPVQLTRRLRSRMIDITSGLQGNSRRYTTHTMNIKVKRFKLEYSTQAHQRYMEGLPSPAPGGRRQPGRPLHLRWSWPCSYSKGAQESQRPAPARPQPILQAPPACRPKLPP